MKLKMLFFSKLKMLFSAVFLIALTLSQVHATCSRRQPTPPQECRQLSQREMHTNYIKCFVDRHFNMSINVEVNDYGIFTSRANQVLNSDDFVSAFDDITSDRCEVDRLQPKNKYWQYVCDYSPTRIPQITWSVECHQEYNPCRNKSIECVCDNTGPLKETSTCSDGVKRILDCTGVCADDEDSCIATYSIAQEWKEFNTTVTYLELSSSGTEFLKSCKVTPMEVYLGSKWQLKREQVAVACTCEEQRPVLCM